MRIEISSNVCTCSLCKDGEPKVVVACLVREWLLSAILRTVNFAMMLLNKQDLLEFDAHRIRI